MKEIERDNALEYFYENMRILDKNKEDEKYEWHELDRCVWECGLLDTGLWGYYLKSREELGLKHLYIPKMPATISKFVKLVRTLQRNDIEKFYVSATPGEIKALDEFTYIAMGEVLINGKKAYEMWAIPTMHHDIKIPKEQYNIYCQDPFDKTTERYKLSHREPIEITGEPLPKEQHFYRYGY